MRTSPKNSAEPVWAGRFEHRVHLSFGGGTPHRERFVHARKFKRWCEQQGWVGGVDFAHNVAEMDRWSNIDITMTFYFNDITKAALFKLFWSEFV